MMNKLIMKFRKKIGISEQSESPPEFKADVKELACPECGHTVACKAPLCDFESKVTD